MSRSTRFSLQLVLSALALGACSAIGCSIDAASTSAESAPPTALQDNGSSSSGTAPPKPVEDAATTRAVPYNGNPLRHVGKLTCMPDDEVPKCDPPVPDGGCRILRDGDGVAPQCKPSKVSGGDGAACEIGEDCAPGFDCVTGVKGKTCRHYCCAGTCKDNQSNGSATFCDVQALVDVNQKAPVCMPLKRCTKLLGSMECSANETCAVVTEAGDTGCVAIGEKRVGESCDEDHCAANLTCFGQPGARKCFKLCKVNASDCPSAQSCVTNAAFKDAAFGVCQ